MPTLTYYMDETGNRQPDKRPDPTRLGRDWFALGGYIVSEDDEDYVKQEYQNFCNRWSINKPLHFTEMVAEKKGFAWLGRIPESRRQEYWSDYRNFLSSLPIIGNGCVIDRPGYVSRGYIDKYIDSKWLLCRSAFDITVERAVKYAIKRECKLNIVFESDISINSTVKNYFLNLKNNGLDFDVNNSAKYNPLSADEFSKTLGTISWKDKQSRMLQIADSYVYAIARGKYERKFHIYRQLQDSKRLMNFHLESADEIKAMGIKYYCF